MYTTLLGRIENNIFTTRIFTKEKKSTGLDGQTVVRQTAGSAVVHVQSGIISALTLPVLLFVFFTYNIK
jgi:hypothetical protein